MGINFAGVDLLLEDSQGAFRDWVDRIIPFEDMRPIAAWPNAVWNGAGFVQPNWSQPLRPKLNTWYSPTGASRWGFGFFLADGSRKASIVQGLQSQSGEQPGTLTFTDNLGTVRSIFPAYLLPPHPVSANNSSLSSAWIMPIVDQRYYWQFTAWRQFSSFPAVATSGTPTWAEAVFSAMSALSISLPVPTISANYLGPNQWEMTRQRWQNAAVAFDAILAAIGMRLVPVESIGLPGTFSFAIHDFATARSVLNAGFQASQYALQVGVLNPAVGDLASITPASVHVAFRSYQDGVVFPDALQDRYELIVNPSDVGITNISPGPFFKTVRSTAVADFTNNGTGADPANKTTLTNLAQQIALDIWNWLSWFQDQTVPGVSPRLHTGFDDYWEIDIGTDARSRIHSLPHNTVLEDLLHWDYTETDISFSGSFFHLPWEYGNFISGVLQSTLPANGAAVIKLSAADVPFPSPNAYLVVTDVSGASTASGTTVTAVKEPLPGTGAISGGSGARGWVVAGGAGASPGSVSTGTFAAIVTAGSSATFTLVGGGTVTATVPFGIGLPSTNYQAGKDQAGNYYVLNPHLEFHCQVSTIQTTPGSPTVQIWTGTAGSETNSGVTTTAYFRRGVLLTGVTYLVEQTASGYEITDPSVHIRGQLTPATDVAADSTGTLNIYTGTGSGTASGVTSPTIRNDSSCVVKASKLAAAEWLDSLGGWIFDVWHAT